jgi:hypothetical protein
MDGIWTRPSAVVIAFPDMASRPVRPPVPSGEPRGEVLLFTGIRYEHSATSPETNRPILSGGPGRRRGP